MNGDTIVVEVRIKSGFIDIRCPSCGSKCPSFLKADDPVLASRTWGADCPKCGRAFNFRVVKL
jgi:ribosomal protein S27E